MASLAVSCPIAARRERIDAAIRFLKQRCILVDPVDRYAAVRRYRMSGCKEPLFAEDVIARAEKLGLEVRHAG